MLNSNNFLNLNNFSEFEMKNIANTTRINSMIDVKFTDLENIEVYITNSDLSNDTFQIAELQLPLLS